MLKIAKAIRMGIATVAVAVAASAVTMAPAQALPAAPMIAGVSGASATAALTPCTPGVGTCAAPGVSAAVVSTTPVYVYIGPANPNAAPKVTILTFSPLPLIPGFLRPLYGWFTQNLDFEVCVGGFSGKVGPYGTFTAAIGSSC